MVSDIWATLQATTELAAVRIICPECKHAVNGGRDYHPYEYKVYFERDDGEPPMCDNCGCFFKPPEYNPFAR
jgi:hypothetical protein